MYLVKLEEFSIQKFDIILRFLGCTDCKTQWVPELTRNGGYTKRVKRSNSPRALSSALVYEMWCDCFGSLEPAMPHHLRPIPGCLLSYLRYAEPNHPEKTSASDNRFRGIVEEYESPHDYVPNKFNNEQYIQRYKRSYCPGPFLNEGFHFVASHATTFTSPLCWWCLLLGCIFLQESSGFLFFSVPVALFPQESGFLFRRFCF